MHISIFELFSIGLGPSSSHLIGPMKAAKAFCKRLKRADQFYQTDALQVHLYGSLSLTGIGHGTDRAILAGLEGNEPDDFDPADMEMTIDRITQTGCIHLLGDRPIQFHHKESLIFEKEHLSFHSNGLWFKAFDREGKLVSEEIYYSIGGGFIVAEEEREQIARKKLEFPHPFFTFNQLKEECEQKQLTIAELMFLNERAYMSEKEIDMQIDRLWKVMQESVYKGCHTEGVLPGGLDLERRAPKMYRSLISSTDLHELDPAVTLDWINLFALAVNEENAAGGRVVTAPTNGSAGIIPALLHYYQKFVPTYTMKGVREFFLTAGAIGWLYKFNASISGAEAGCQGEVGVASSMGAAGLCAVMGGDVRQIEIAAEIAMEHHLGLPCDPIGGLVQVPCIERNAMGAIHALNAARLALRREDDGFVSLDEVIQTMNEVARDMHDKYKETSKGGLAKFVQLGNKRKIATPIC
ncbi:MAG: L-serine dehydratase TdcG [Chlamydiia bacterium]|nr:L-serine dehydratase TdcG [Chlamydiia bacterium]